MATIQIRVDDKLKKASNEILNDLGLDMSAAVRMFLTQVINQKTLPLCSFVSPERYQELDEMAEEALRDYKTGKEKGYSSAEEMMQDILG
jgi:DNA-damage-inducible protein J